MKKNYYYEEIKDVLFIFGIIGWVIFLIVPMPAVVIDISISLMIGLSIVVLVQASTIDTWSKFKTFPLILLMSTIFRIALSIATTRKIISGESPGQVIESSGHFIVGDKIAIGFVMFIILIIVQFIIAFGANRFGEVSARFELDSLPGKQMSIDNDLNQGSIDSETAKRQKAELQQQVNYYGSLDGAGKYIKGDVWAGVSMIIVNLVVGLIVGMVELNLTFQESLNRFTILSVGDGVVMLICALMVTVSGAIVMAKVEETEVDREDESGKSFLSVIFGELSSSSKNLYVVGVVLILLGIVGLPFIPLATIGVLMFIVAYIVQRNQKREVEESAKKAQEVREMESRKLEEVKVVREVEPITIETGYKLAPLFRDKGVDIFGNRREGMQDKILLMRKYFANRLGVEIPNIKIRDKITLYPETKYEINIKESLVDDGVIMKDKVLAIPSLHTFSEVEGTPTKDPVFGQDALWIDEELVQEADSYGYDVWDPLNIIATHLHDVLEKNIWQFITLQKVTDMVDELSENHKILKDKMDESGNISLLQKVIISLLKEKVSIKDLPTIIEAFLEAEKQTDEIDIIVSVVRQRISRQICENYISSNGKLYLLGVANEEEIAIEKSGGMNRIAMSYQWQLDFVEKLKKEKANAKAANVDPVVIVKNPELRPALKGMIEMLQAETPVISVFELPSTVDNKILTNI